MKKIEYQAPEMEVIEMMSEIILVGSVPAEGEEVPGEGQGF